MWQSPNTVVSLRCHLECLRRTVPGTWSPQRVVFSLGSARRPRAEHLGTVGRAREKTTGPADDRASRVRPTCARNERVCAHVFGTVQEDNQQHVTPLSRSHNCIHRREALASKTAGAAACKRFDRVPEEKGILQALRSGCVLRGAGDK